MPADRDGVTHLALDSVRCGGWEVFTLGMVVLPWHHHGPASVQQRLAQHGRRQAHLARKHPRQRPDAARQTDPWVVLFTSHPTWLAAVRSYDRRWSTEGSYRDAQGGWDGQHGWDLEVTLARLTDAVAVQRVVGLWALGALVQTWVGHRLGQPSAVEPVPLLRREWTTTGRLSVWARGQFALTDASGRFRPWLRQVLTAGAHRLAITPPPVCHSTPGSTPLSMAPQVAA